MDRSDIQRMLARMRGEGGSDQATDGIITVPAASGWRAVTFTASPDDLSAGRGVRLGLGEHGHVTLRLVATGEGLGFRHGKLLFEPGDGAAAEALVQLVGEWLAVELGSAQPIDGSRVDASYVHIATREGRDVYKCFLAAGEELYAELFLRIAEDRSEAAFTEKWSRYRQDWVNLFAAVMGVRLGVAMSAPEQLPAAGGSFELPGARVTVPDGWCRLRNDPSAELVLVDATDSMRFQMSVWPLPLHAGAHPRQVPVPPVAELVRRVLDDHDARRSSPPISATWIGDGLPAAWAEIGILSSDSADPARPERHARARWMIAVGKLQAALVSFTFWDEDRAAGLKAWRAIVPTLHVD